LFVAAKQYDLWNSKEMEHLMNKILDDWSVSASKNHGEMITPPATGNGVFQKKIPSPAMQQILGAINSIMLAPPSNGIRDESYRKHVPKRYTVDQ
jgi:hypothetical protein